MAPSPSASQTATSSRGGTRGEGRRRRRRPHARPPGLGWLPAGKRCGPPSCAAPPAPPAGPPTNTARLDPVCVCVCRYEPNSYGYRGDTGRKHHSSLPVRGEEYGPAFGCAAAAAACTSVLPAGRPAWGTVVPPCPACLPGAALCCAVCASWVGCRCARLPPPSAMASRVALAGAGLAMWWELASTYPSTRYSSREGQRPAPPAPLPSLPASHPASHGSSSRGEPLRLLPRALTPPCAPRAAAAPAPLPAARMDSTWAPPFAT